MRWLVLCLVCGNAFGVTLRERQGLIHLARQTETEYKLPEALLHAIIQQESSYRAQAVNPATREGTAVDSFGLGQLTADTAGWHCGLRGDQLYHPAKNMKCSAQVLKWQLNRYDGDIAFAVAAYNWGTPCVCDGIMFIQKLDTRTRICMSRATRRPLLCREDQEGVFWNQEYVDSVMEKQGWERTNLYLKGCYSLTPCTVTPMGTWYKVFLP